MQKSVLIADTEVPAEFIRQAIEKRFPLATCVHTFNDAVDALATGTFGLIICGLHFDESRMMELLWRVKELPEYKDVPFLCVRMLEAHHEISQSVKSTHEALGAAGFLEVSEMNAVGAKLLIEELDKLSL
jgi:DNA-binding NtrC family response regulator